MIYNAVGLMSGSSLDGLDIALVRLTEKAGRWSYEWIATDCISYSEEWVAQLRQANTLSAPGFLKLHTAYGHFTGKLVKDFLDKKASDAEVHFIASHGHTVFHEPHNATTCQIGDGAAIAAATGIPTISDLRSMDVALGGQGAPIVPIGDRLLFSDYDYLLNLGGIANVSIQSSGIAFDICPCNQLLDYYARRAGRAYDDSGRLAQSGAPHVPLIAELSNQEYYALKPPKSLANDFSTHTILPIIDAKNLSPEDALSSSSRHIVDCITTALLPFTDEQADRKLLVTGGGALNTYLMELLYDALDEHGISLVIPDKRLIQYKEALVMALIGALRWRNEPNVLSSVTGAGRDSIGGAIWAGKMH